MKPWLRRLILASAALWLLFLVVANGSLAAPWGRRLVNSAPQKFSAQWRSCWTPWPGVFYLRDAQIRGTTRRWSWTATAERATIRISIAPLAIRTLRFPIIHARGATFDLQPQAAAQGANLPQNASGRGRTIRFDDLRFDELRELRWQGFAVRGRSAVRASFGLRTRGGPATLTSMRLDLESAELEVAGRTVARELTGAVAASSEPFVAREHPGASKFDFFSGSADVRGRAVPVLLGDASPPVTGDGRFDLELQLEHGVLRSGSRAHVVLPFAERRSDGTTLEEEVVLDLQVEDRAGTAHLRAFAEAPRADFELAGTPPTRLSTGAIRLSAEAPDARLSRILGVVPRDHAKPAGLVAAVDISALRLETPLGPAGVALSAGRLSGRLDVAAAAEKRLVLEGLRGEGLELDLDLPIEREAKEHGTRAAWSIDVRDALFDDVRVFEWQDVLRMQGSHRLAFDFAIAPDRTLDVRRVEVALPDGRLIDRGGGLAGRLKVDLRLSPFQATTGQALDVLAHADGTLDLDTEVASLQFVDRLLRNTAWFDIDGRGTVRASLRLAHGSLEPGSSIDVPRAEVDVRIRDDVASGSARAFLRVEQGASGPRETGEILLSRFDLAPARSTAPPFARGTNLRIRAEATHTRIDEIAQDARVEATLERAEIVDLGALREFLPASSGIDLAGGSGTLSLRVEADSAANTGRGTTALRIQDAHVRLFDVGLHGALAFDGRFKSSDLKGGAFALDGTRLALTDVMYEEGEGPRKTPWSGELVLETAQAAHSRPLVMRGRLSAQFSDSGLLLALFAAKKHFPEWTAKLLNVRDVGAGADFELSEAGLTVDRLEIGGGHMHVLGRFRRDREHPAGDLYFKWGPFAAAAERDGPHHKFHLHEPLRWYQSRPAYLEPLGTRTGEPR